MRLLLVFALVLALIQPGCGGLVAVGNFDGDASRVVVVSGTVTSVGLSNVVIGGGFTQVTVVTLFNGGLNSSTSFCGNHTAQFPTGSFVQVNFNPGAGCNSIAVVVVG